MEELMLRIDNVSKKYVLGQIGGTTLRDELQRLSARMHGREDPTRMIGAKDYNRGETFMALDGVSFDVKKGERVGIIGHNGAGKSTLLKLISRVTAPTGGRIGLNGRVASMLEVGTGFHGELTGRENIYMNGAILGMTKKEIDAKIEDIIEFSECRQFIDTPVKRYSSGMYVKLAFSVAAHLDSEIMIMDEVLAVGDMAFQKKCLEKMNDVSRSEGRTILYVSHNMNTIRQLCDRVIVLDHGKVVFDGGVEEGIGVYMGNGAALCIVNDCSKERNPGYRLDGNLTIQQLIFINKDYPVYLQNENLLFTVNYKSKRRIPNMAFRLTVISDDGVIVGQATTKPCIMTNIGQNQITASLNMTTLAPGRYILNLIAYEVGEFGGNRVLDVVENACMFELLEKTGFNNEMKWNRRWWGYLAFPELEIMYGIERY